MHLNAGVQFGTRRQHYEMWAEVWKILSSVVIYRMCVSHNMLFLVLTLALNVTGCQGCLSHHSIAAHPLNLIQNKECIDTWFLGS